ncbi:serine/threonine-protein kinase [Actinacidiphila rubida]|uniref:non-specific serine/threonine protein kinase n=1 Tax=Actinacidiphila rubida TaxID=310780 RepID=A0A1H8UK36_9ACTN|nr:serine/threonine-protein kinase [Actinacidiphila rubida]SEP03224.1 Serine/threonine protein kinase [Actinacidiphila rubida]
MANNGGGDGRPVDEAARTATSYVLRPPEERPAEQPGGQPATAVSDVPEPDGQPTARPAGSPTGGGRLVGGRYRLVERLGFGGMGTVWRAHDEVVDRDVAVKEPRVPEHMTGAQRETAYLRMQREARAAAKIDHPSVVTVHDVVIEDERPWIVMELVRGRSLAEVLAEGTLPPREAARIGLAVLGALSAAHEAGVLHRDVKPANILLGRHDRVVLTDFGIAQVEGEEPLTETGAFIGSPEYIAPERVLGHRPGPESDLWSLGIVLYQAVEGVSPFRRQATPSTFQAVLLADLPAPREAGPLAATILGVLRKEPAVRTTAARLADELRTVLDPPRVPRQQGGGAGEAAEAAGAAGTAAAGPSAGARALRTLRRSRRAQVLTGAVAAVAVAAVVLALVPPFGSGLPKGWKTYQEAGVDATVAVPGDYVRSIADKKVTYTAPHKVFVVTLTKTQGEKGSAEGVANANLDWYRKGGQINYSDTAQDADGRVTEATQQDRPAARLDVHYTDLTDDAHPAMREAEMDVVSGKGDAYTLDVVMPAAAAQSAQGQRIFDQIRAHLTLHSL